MLCWCDCYVWLYCLYFVGGCVWLVRWLIVWLMWLGWFWVCMVGVFSMVLVGVYVVGLCFCCDVLLMGLFCW